MTEECKNKPKLLLLSRDQQNTHSITQVENPNDIFVVHITRQDHKNILGLIKRWEDHKERVRRGYESKFVKEHRAIKSKPALLVVNVIQAPL